MCGGPPTLRFCSCSLTSQVSQVACKKTARIQGVPFFLLDGMLFSLDRREIVRTRRARQLRLGCLAMIAPASSTLRKTPHVV